MIPRHIHTPDDGRPHNRRVLVDGVELKGVVYADTRRGIARRYRDPIKLDKWKKRALTETIRGRVEVVTE